MIKLVEWTIDEAGKAFGELEVLLHTPLYPITDYHFKVSDDLWRGSWPNTEDLTFLRLKGVKTVINLCAERHQVVPSTFDNVDVPIVDNTPPNAEQLDFLLHTFTDHAPVYVHCEQGKGRTGCAVAAYRVLVQGWSPAAALHEAVNFGLAFPAQKDWILALK